MADTDLALHSTSTNRKVIVCAITGGLGAGKSTLLDTLSKSEFPNVVVKHEPVEDFNNFDDGRFQPLDLYYSDPKKYCGFSQLHIIRKLEKCFEEMMESLPLGTEIVFTERTIFSPMMFTNAMRKCDFMSDFESVYLLNESAESIWKMINRGYPILDKIFHIDAPVDQCIKNVEKRGRSRPEVDFPQMRDLLHYLDEEYHNFMEKFEKVHGKSSVKRVAYSTPENTFKQFLAFVQSF